MKKLALVSLITTIVVGMENQQTTPTIIATLASKVGPVMGTQFTPDGQRLVTNGPYPVVQVWNTSDYADNPSDIPTTNETQSTLGISPDGMQIALGYVLYEKPIFLIDLMTGKTAQRIDAENLNGTNTLQYTFDKTSLLSAQGNGSCKLWDLATDKQCKTFNLPDSVIASDLQIDPINIYQFATAYVDSNKVAIWDIRNEKLPIATLTEQVPCTTLAYNKKGLLAVGGYYNLYIHDQKMALRALYDLQGNKMKPGQYPIAQATTNYAPWTPNGITFMPTDDDILVASINTRDIVIYNLADQSKTFKFVSQDSIAPQEVDVHPNGQTMAIGGYMPAQTYIYDSSGLDQLKVETKDQLSGHDALKSNILKTQTNNSQTKSGLLNCSVS